MHPTTISPNNKLVVSNTHKDMDLNSTAHESITEALRTFTTMVVTAIVGIFGGWMWSNANKVSIKRYEEDQAKLQAELVATKAQLAIHNNELVGVKVLLTAIKEHMDEGFKSLREDLRHDRNQ